MGPDRLSSLPKKDRDWIAEWLSTRAGEEDDPLGTKVAWFTAAAAHFRLKSARLEARGPVKGASIQRVEDLLYSDLHHLSAWLTTSGGAHRLVHDDCAELARCLATASRLTYLHETLPPTSRSGYDCMYAKGVLLSLAARDFAAVSAYQASFPQLSKNGTGYLVDLANMLGCALGSGDAFAGWKTPMKRGHSKHERAVLEAIAAIIADDPAQFSTALEDVLSLHRAVARDDGLLRYFSITAHALYNLADRVMPSRSRLAPPSNALWDQDVYETSAAEADLESLKAYSPEIAVQAKMLPRRA